MCASLIEALFVGELKEGSGGIRLKRGGARNRSDRVTLQLSLNQCKTAFAACHAALTASMPLNRFITISWELGGVAPKRSGQATGQFIKMAREWMASHGFKTTWMWVQECGDVIGAHCHILMHVPPILDPLFRSKPRSWVKRVLGGRYVGGVLLTKRLLHAPRAGRVSDAYRAEIHGRIHYMLKCAPAQFEPNLDVHGWSVVSWGKKQLVFGKRLCVWQGWRRANLNSQASALP